MIAIPSNVRVWLATGHTDMRRGMQGLALQVQEGLSHRDPHVGDLFVFRGKRGNLVKITLARWARPVALRQAAGPRPVRLAGRRRIGDCSRRRSSPICSKGSTGAIPQHTWRPASGGLTTAASHNSQ